VSFTLEAWEMTVRERGLAVAECVMPQRFEVLEDDYQRGNTERPGHDIFRVAGFDAEGNECFRLEEISEWAFDPATVDKRRLRDDKEVRQLVNAGEWKTFMSPRPDA
jgi:hypothetical protein